MGSIDLSYICTVIGNLAGIPVRIFHGSERVFYHALVALPEDPMAAFRKEIMAVDSPVGYFITPYFHYYGVMNSGGDKLVIGPSIQIQQSEQTLRELAFRCDVSPDETPDFVRAMKSIVPMPLTGILQILCILHYVITGEKVSPGDIAIHEAEQQRLKHTVETERASRHFEQDVGEEFPHNTLAPEQTILNFIRRGDSLGLKEWLRDMPPIRGGTLASDQLRQLKNTFIVSTALASRSAIRGGMDIDDAFSLSDAYIRKGELMSTMDQITDLQYHMLLDYTERVERLRVARAPSRFVSEVANYVHHHLSEVISTEKMAGALFMNRSWMSVKFRQETGLTLTDFILKEKTEEAKRLLRYTDKPTAAISAYLGFSSQSHFSRVFKKYAGTSPNEYRKRHLH